MNDVDPSLHINKEPKGFLSHGFKFSILLHVTLVLWLFAHWAAVTFSPYSEKEKKFARPKQSIRVDMVDLPTLKMQELHQVDLTKEASEKKIEEKKEEIVVPPPPNPTAMQLPVKKSEVVINKKDEKKSPDKSRLEELQKSIRAEARRQEVLSKFKKEVKGDDENKRVKLGGNILSKGGSVQGEVADESGEYEASVTTHVQKFWIQPTWAAGANLKAHVTVKLSPTGRVLSKKISVSSGRVEFDKSALEAVEAADPFPAPPELLKRIALQEGVECRFPD
jgi:TonB family protein